MGPPKRVVIKAWDQQSMGPPRHGANKAWEHQGMGPPKHGVTMAWGQQSMGVPRNGVTKASDHQSLGPTRHRTTMSWTHQNTWPPKHGATKACGHQGMGPALLCVSPGVGLPISPAAQCLSLCRGGVPEGDVVAPVIQWERPGVHGFMVGEGGAASSSSQEGHCCHPLQGTWGERVVPISPGCVSPAGGLHAAGVPIRPLPGPGAVPAGAEG